MIKIKRTIRIHKQVSSLFLCRRCSIVRRDVKEFFGGVSTFDMLYYSIFFVNIKRFQYFFYEQRYRDKKAAKKPGAPLRELRAEFRSVCAAGRSFDLRTLDQMP